MRKLLAISSLLLVCYWLLPVMQAHAQCTGLFPATTMCGNNHGSKHAPGPIPYIQSPGSTVIGNPVVWGNTIGTQLSTGSLTGNTLKFVTGGASSFSGCPQWDSNGNLIGVSGACGVVAALTSTFGASGSANTTTGSILTTQATLNLVSVLDFKNGEGIIVNHAGATFATNPPTGLIITQAGTPGTTHTAYQIASFDCSGGVGIAIAPVTTTTGPAAFSNTDYNILNWSYPISGPTPCGFAIYRDDGGGPFLLGYSFTSTYNDFGNGPESQPFWITGSPLVAALNDWLLTSISAGGGTTSLTLANTAAQSVVGATVLHDDSVAIQAAINSLPVNGGVVQLTGLSGNNFNICCQVNIGNGTSSTFSTIYGVKIAGMTQPEGVLSIPPLPTPAGTVWNETGPSSWLQINGPLSGFGIENIFFACNDMHIGMLVFSAKDGDSRNLSFQNCLGIGLYLTTQPTSGYAGSPNTDNLHDNWTHLQFQVPQIGANVDALQVSGAADGSSDTDYNTFRDILVLNPGGVGLAYCVDNIVSDSNIFINVHCITNDQSGILFNYCLNNGFPNSATFFGVDSPVVANSCSPNGIGQSPNKLYSFINANANHCPVNVNNLLCDGQEWISTAGCSNSGGTLTACTTTITWPTPFIDNGYFPFCELADVTAAHPMIVGSIARSVDGTQATVQQFSTVGGATSGTLLCHAWHP